jgi:hypothetical protein
VYGDFSRVLDPRPGRHTAVWAQQGRLQLDADLNEQTAIVLDYLRTLAVDLIGPFGGHIHRAGFEVSLAPAPGQANRLTVKLSEGHYYVFGLRCEAPAPEHRHGPIDLGQHELPAIVELLVWEQTVGPIQEPALIEPALGLGAPDTALRSRVTWRVHATRHLAGAERHLAQEPPEEIVEAYAAHPQDRLGRPRLRAHATVAAVPDPDLQPAPVGSAYCGVENQLYRVEVHTGGGAGEATFKWSRDNGSVALALESIADPTDEGQRTATLAGRWRDAAAGLSAGDWVELVDDHWAPAGEPTILLLVEQVTLATREVRLLGPPDGPRAAGLRHPFLRRWDQHSSELGEDNAIPLREVTGEEDEEPEWIDLEDGVQIQFAACGARYQRGDYWLIPARTAIGGVLWPTNSDGAPEARQPDGPARHRAPLALVRSPASEDVVDLRTRFTHLAWPELERGE